MPSCISQNAPWAAAASAASAARSASGCTSGSGRWRNTNRSRPSKRSRTRRTIDCAAVQYGHWKSPYMTSSSGASYGPATWSEESTGGVSTGHDPRLRAGVANLELLFALLFGAVLLVRVADHVGIPYPIVLVVGGLGLALAQVEFTLDPEVALLVFVPPLLLS